MTTTAQRRLERVTQQREANEQLLYFTSTSLTTDDRRLVFISNRTGHPNLFDRDLVTGAERQLTHNAEGHLKSYVYFFLFAGGTTTFDQVTILDAARLAVLSEGESYVVEAAIPLKAIGLSVTPGMALKMDWGILTTDDGFVTRSRQYWANPMATGVADEPTEARLQPAVWGHVRFVGLETHPGLDSILEPTGSDPALEELLDDFFSEEAEGEASTAQRAGAGDA